VVSGGILCVLGVVTMAAVLPKFRLYRRAVANQD
jgi:hypothetical protein